MADFHEIECRDCGKTAFVPDNYVVCPACWIVEFEAWHSAKRRELRARERLDGNG